MTRKDYIKFAALFASELAGTRNDDRTYWKTKGIMLSIADIFAHDNPRFNRNKFYMACEPVKGQEDHVKN